MQKIARFSKSGLHYFLGIEGLWAVVQATCTIFLRSSIGILVNPSIQMHTPLKIPSPEYDTLHNIKCSSAGRVGINIDIENDIENDWD